MCSASVDIDSIAGPSEIVVLADETADPAYVAADLLSQAEHDEMASAILVTPSRQLAEAVAAEVERQLATLPREDIARQSIDDYGAILLADSMDEGDRRRQPAGAGASGDHGGGADDAAWPDRECGRDLPRAVQLGAGRRLFRRTEPHSADERHGAVLFAGECG